MNKILLSFIDKYKSNKQNNYSNNLINLLSSNVKNHCKLTSCYNEHISKIITNVNKFKLFLKGDHPMITCNFCFVGNPGTCKTYTCKAIAYELERTPIEINLLKYLFEDELYKFIFTENDYKKCVYIFEEIDAFCPVIKNDKDINNSMKKIMLKGINPVIDNKDNKDNKDKDNNINIIGSRKIPVTLRTLLTLLSGVESKYEACFLANANDVSKLDKALIRAARLKLLEFKNLRKKILLICYQNYDQTEIIKNINFYDDYMLSGASVRYIMNCTNNLEEFIDEIKIELSL
jgi:ATP-dependent 26S proteasome regulatory subunit